MFSDSVVMILNFDRAYLSVAYPTVHFECLGSICKDFEGFRQILMVPVKRTDQNNSEWYDIEHVSKFALEAK